MAADSQRSADVVWIVDTDDEQGLSLWIVGKWERFMRVMCRARRFLNFALVIGNTARRRFSGEFRHRMRQADQLSD